MGDLVDLQKQVIKFRDDRDWKQFHNHKDTALSMVLEAAEYMEHFQWKSADEIEAYVQSNKQDLGDELADVLYWVLLISNDLEINLTEALKAKLSKNDAKYPVNKAKGSHAKYTQL